MKSINFLLFIGLILMGCKSMDFYGNKISEADVVKYEDVKQKAFDEGRIQTQISGKILETCPKKGCWMSMATESDTVFVRFRDYGFFVPTEGVEGKTAFIEGDLFVDTISVRMLQHYAKDAGKSKEEIAKITEPELGLSFTADGVIIKK
tara:strand:+ start:1178 stop:1624 length:447 start_codon:yes stop_codon:yes gene_type:complete